MRNQVISGDRLVLDTASIPESVDFLPRGILLIDAVGVTAADRLFQVVAVELIDFVFGQQTGERVHHALVHRITAADHRIVEAVAFVHDDDNLRHAVRIGDQFAIVRSQARSTPAGVTAIRQVTLGRRRQKTAA